MELTTTEVLERIAEGDMQTVIRNIADPLERWEMECRVQAIHVADEDCTDEDAVAELIEAAENAIFDAIALVDSDLAGEITGAMEHREQKDRKAAITGALDQYAAKRFAELAEKLRADATEKLKRPVNVVAAAIAEREAAIRSTGPTTLVFQR